MKIVITRGSGTGPTRLAAYDAALHRAGVGNHNLICLSSVIPPGSAVERGAYSTSADEHGHRLYVVLAVAHAGEAGARACAGLGWAQDEADGRGLFVEAGGSDGEVVRSEIVTTLEAMVGLRGARYGPIETEVEEAGPGEAHTCAVVVAVFGSQGWG